MIIEQKECEGCLSYYIPFGNLYHECVIKIPIISPTVKCPCMDCLLKMICEEECERFTLYKNTSKLRQHFELKRDYGQDSKHM